MFKLTLITALLTLATADINPPTLPPADSPYVSGYPLCEIPGYTWIPGNFTETFEPGSAWTLQSCLDQCRVNTPCESIAYLANYTVCIFFDHVVEDTQLTMDNSSPFVHYDLECFVGKK